MTRTGWARWLRWVPATFVAIVVPWIVHAASLTSDVKRPITYEDLVGATDAYGAFAISDNGKFVAYVQRGTVFFSAISAGAGTVKVGDGLFPSWSPDASNLAFYSTATGELQLWVYDLRAHNAHPVTALPGGINPDPYSGWLAGSAGSMDGSFTYGWSPDGKKLVFASRVQNRDRSSGLGSAQLAKRPYLPLVLDGTTVGDLTLSGVFGHGGGVAQTDGRNISSSGPVTLAGVPQLFVVEVSRDAPQVRQLTEGAAGCFHPAWSPNGAAIACSTAHGRPINESLETADIVRIDAVTGHRLGSTSGKGVKYLPTWSARGENIVYLEIHEAGALGVPELYSWNWKRERMSALTPQLPVRVQTYQIDVSRDKVVFLSEAGQLSQLQRVGFDGNAPKIIREEAEDRLPTKFLVDKRGDIAWSVITNDNPGVIEIFASDGKRPRRIVDLNPESADWVLGTRKAVHWTNGRGDQLDGIVIEPPGFNPSRPYPTIVDAYPLTRGSGWSPLAGNQVWAVKGYLVFIPAPRGPHVWMNDWSTRSYGLVAQGEGGWEVTQDDLMSGVNALVTRGLADQQRICIYGHSNGGTDVLNVIARTSAFKCAVAVAPVMLDWLHNATLRTNGVAWAKTMLGSKSIFDDPMPYLKLSVIYNASTIRTPTLLAVGDADQPGTVLGTISMYNSLRYLGRDVTLLRYSDQGHVFQGEAMKDLWDRELRFIGSHLGDVSSLSQGEENN